MEGSIGVVRGPVRTRACEPWVSVFGLPLSTLPSLIASLIALISITLPRFLQHKGKVKLKNHT